MLSIKVHPLESSYQLQIDKMSKAPLCQEDQILIQSKAFGLNRMDLLQARGLYPAPPSHSPILGVEVAGVVKEIGPNVSGFHIGQEVMALVPGGGYGSVVATYPAMIHPKPSHLSFEQAASLPEALYTNTALLLEEGRLQQGQSLLYHGGSSGMGSIAIQMAKLLKAHCYVTVKNKQKAAFCKELGATDAFLYPEGNWHELLEKMEENIDLIVDMVAGEYVPKHLSLIKPYGKILLIALLGGNKMECSIAPILLKNIQLQGFTLRNKPLSYFETLQSLIQKHWIEPLENNTLKPCIDHIYPVTEIQQAHQAFKQQSPMGKIVIRWQ